MDTTSNELSSHETEEKIKEHTAPSMSSTSNYGSKNTDSTPSSLGGVNVLEWNTYFREDQTPPYAASPWSQHSVSIVLLDLKDVHIQDSLHRIERLRKCIATQPMYDHSVLFFGVGNGVYWLDQEATQGIDMVGRTAEPLSEEGTAMSADEQERRFHYSVKQQSRICRRARFGKWSKLPVQHSLEDMLKKLRAILQSDAQQLPPVSDEERMAGMWQTGLWIATLLGGPQETLFPSINVLCLVSDKSLSRLCTSPEIYKDKVRRKRRTTLGAPWSSVLLSTLRQLSQDTSMGTTMQKLNHYLQEIRWIWAFSLQENTLDITQHSQNAPMMFRSLQQLLPLTKGSQYLLPRFPHDPPYYWEYGCLSSWILCPLWSVSCYQSSSSTHENNNSSTPVSSSSSFPATPFVEYLHGKHVRFARIFETEISSEMGSKDIPNALEEKATVLQSTYTDGDILAAHNEGKWTVRERGFGGSSHRKNAHKKLHTWDAASDQTKTVLRDGTHPIHYGRFVHSSSSYDTTRDTGANGTLDSDNDRLSKPKSKQNFQYADKDVSPHTMDQAFATSMAYEILWKSPTQQKPSQEAVSETNSEISHKTKTQTVVPTLRNWHELLDHVPHAYARLSVNFDHKKASTFKRSSYPLCYHFLHYLYVLCDMKQQGLFLTERESDTSVSSSSSSSSSAWYPQQLRALRAAEQVFRMQSFAWNVYYHGEWALTTIPEGIDDYIHFMNHATESSWSSLSSVLPVTTTEHQEKGKKDTPFPYLVDIQRDHTGRLCYTESLREHICSRLTDCIDDRAQAVRGRGEGETEKGKQRHGSSSQFSWLTNLRGIVLWISPTFSNIRHLYYATTLRRPCAKTLSPQEMEGDQDTYSLLIPSGLDNNDDQEQEEKEEEEKEDKEETKRNQTLQLFSRSEPLYCPLEAWWGLIDRQWKANWDKLAPKRGIPYGQRQWVNKQLRILSTQQKQENNHPKHLTPLFCPTLPDEVHVLAGTYMRQDILGFLHAEWQSQLGKNGEYLEYAFTPSSVGLLYTRTFLGLWQQEQYVAASRMLRMLLVLVALLGDRIFPIYPEEVALWLSPLDVDKQEFVLDTLGCVYCISMALFTSSEEYAKSHRHEARRKLFEHIYERKPEEDEFRRWVDDNENAVNKLPGKGGNQSDLSNISNELRQWIDVDHQEGMALFDYSFFHCRGFLEYASPAYRVEESLLKAERRVHERKKSQDKSMTDTTKAKETATDDDDDDEESNYTVNEQEKQQQTKEEKEEDEQEKDVTELRQQYGKVPSRYFMLAQWSMLLWLYSPDHFEQERLLREKIHTLQEEWERENTTSSSLTKDNETTYNQGEMQEKQSEAAPNNTENTAKEDYSNTQQDNNIKPNEETTFVWPFTPSSVTCGDKGHGKANANKNSIHTSSTADDFEYSDIARQLYPSFKWYQEKYMMKGRNSLCLGFVEALSGLSLRWRDQQNKTTT
jgi:hypothetical protein